MYNSTTYQYNHICACTASKLGRLSHMHLCRRRPGQRPDRLIWNTRPNYTQLTGQIDSYACDLDIRIINSQYHHRMRGIGPGHLTIPACGIAIRAALAILHLVHIHDVIHNHFQFSPEGSGAELMPKNGSLIHTDIKRHAMATDIVRHIRNKPKKLQKNFYNKTNMMASLLFYTYKIPQKTIVLALANTPKTKSLLRCFDAVGRAAGRASSL